jgi:2-oxoglutarate ferredoxin oxidoreductase subunit alpha
MSRVRGGSNSVEIRASRVPVRAFVDRIDIFIPFDQVTRERLQGRCHEQTLIAGDPEKLLSGDYFFELPLLKMAQEAGNKILANTIASGFLVGLMALDVSFLEATLDQKFSHQDAGLLEQNLVAARAGWQVGSQAAAGRSSLFSTGEAGNRAERLFLNGHQAVGLGAIAGGCSFISSYPMSPSTGVLTFLAKQAREFGIVVEQAEDEISAINMGIGSWYAGGRAMVTTSGGGFALMTEGVSLAGIVESPIVIHIAQRPGPGTGLPTRTEQGDLDLALYAGHGEFPRAILAPGTLEDAVLCAALAFDMADAAQTPVFILTDQYLLDSYYDVAELPLPKNPPESQLVETAADYKRYSYSEDGVSPRGIPGFGQGVVRFDSDEHDEEGVITEDADVRIAMMDKRLGKFARLGGEHALPPRLYGAEEYSRLIVGWGSTCDTVIEALAQIDDGQTAFLYCPQVFPVPDQVTEFIDKAEELIFIENNATGQFARLIHRETGFSADEHWLKYDGLPFSVEDVVALVNGEALV